MSLLRFAGPLNIGMAADAALMGAALQSAGRPALDTVFGSGLIWHSDVLRPVVLVSQERVPQTAGIWPLPQVMPAIEIVRAALTVEPPWLFATLAYVLPPAEPQAGPGGPISAPVGGTIGCCAQWTGGAGFLTAGHVGSMNGTDLFDHGMKLGTVRYAHDPAGGGTAVGADVAVVELAPGQAFAAPCVGVTTAGPSDAVHLLGTGKAGTIMGFCSFVHWPKVSGTYGDTYFTTQDVSVGGDSGTAVTRVGKIVGMVIGGTPKWTSFIQDAQYQLGQIGGAAAGLPGLAL